MSLKTKVKVGYVDNLSEARYCAGMGVDMLGFPVGRKGLDPAAYKQLIGWVSGPEFVLETQSAGPDEKDYVTANYPGHLIRIGTDQLDWLDDVALNFIVAIRAEQWTSIRGILAGKQNIRYLELSVDNPSEKLLEEIHTHYPILLVVENPATALAMLTLPIDGIALTGSREDRPGMMEYGLSEILESLEE